MGLRKNCFIALIAGVVGCAGAEAARVDDSALVRLPAQAKNAVLDRQRDVNVAESNLEAMRVAAREAEKFKGIVEEERSAAASRLDAVRRTLDLASTSRDQNMRQDAQKSEPVVRLRLAASEAKLEYARALEELRRAQVSGAEAELAAAKAHLERTKFQQLQANNMADRLDGESFEEAVNDADDRLKEEREKEVGHRAEVAERQQRWQERWKEYRELAGPNGETGTDAPAPPEPIRSRPNQANR